MSISVRLLTARVVAATALGYALTLIFPHTTASACAVCSQTNCLSTSAGFQGCGVRGNPSMCYYTDLQACP
jgi:hypothetical protein